MSLAQGVVTAAAFYAYESILVKPRRSLGLIIPQVVVEEVHHDDLEITEHPIEQGAAIADHAFKRPADLIIRCAWSNSASVAGLGKGVVQGVTTTVTGVQSAVTGNSAAQIRDIYDSLLKLQEQRDPFIVYTGKRVYTNMLIRSLAVTTDKTTENSLVVVIVLRQVILVQTQLVFVAAPASRQADPAATQATINSGTKSLDPAPKFRTQDAY
jgi:hypothetical protein